jgi:branched-chain amino acid aminotransferase
MLNHNGTLVSDLSLNNRGFLYGDSVFETMRVSGNTIYFFEAHYFRLMASMRILRMEIPMSWTMEFLKDRIIETVNAQGLENSRVRLSVYREGAGYYLPKDKEVSYVISAANLDNELYAVTEAAYEVDLYSDFTVSACLLSTLKTNNKALHVTAAIYADENGLDNCLLINDYKNVVEAVNGNIFLFSDQKLVTPPLSEGCLNGIMRKQILQLVRKSGAIEVLERAVSPFEIQSADELFITNVVSGITPVTRYRKKDFTTTFAAELVVTLNSELASLT